MPNLGVLGGLGINKQPRADKMKERVMYDVEQAKSALSLRKADVASALGQKAGEAAMKPLVEVSRQYKYS